MDDFHDLSTEWLSIPVRDGDDASVMQAYLARPAGAGRWPVVLVGFEMFGVTGFARSVAERLARVGYLALVPDFYHWQYADGEHIELEADDAGRARGLALMNGLRRGQVTADVHALIATAVGRPDCAAQAGVAFFGMSAGAHIAYYAATQVPLSALIALYPGWLSEVGTALSQDAPIVALTPEIARQGTPVLLEVGTDDFLFGPGQLDQIRAALADAGVQHEVISYPGTPHGFFNPERDTYRHAAAADAWTRALRLLAATAKTAVD